MQPPERASAPTLQTSAAPSRELWLASSSPRRRELLAQAGYTFEIRTPAVDETRQSGESPADYVRRLARDKAAAIQAPSQVVIVAADTAVVLGDQILDKPGDAAEARETLARLSGAWHRVLTGFCVTGPGEAPRAELSETKVRFKRLSEEEIGLYVDSGEWRGKAGGYAIQGRAAFMVAELKGSYTNVVGLPLTEVVERLTAHGVRPDPAGGRRE